MKRIAGTGEQSLMNYKWGYAHVNKFIVFAEGLDIFRIAAVATGGWMILSGNLSF
jgi:hypothetical protein